MTAKETDDCAKAFKSRCISRPSSFCSPRRVFFIASSLFPLSSPGNNIGDSLLYLAPGQRMYQGEMIYRDVFEFVTPGTALVNFLMFKLFGLRLWIPDLLALLLGLGLAWLGVVISRKLMRPSLALLPSAIFLVSARAFLYDPTHHWYSVLAAIAAIAVLMERRTPARIFAAGFLCGLSACFTQTRGLAVVVGFAALFMVGIPAEARGLAQAAQKRGLAAHQFPRSSSGCELLISSGRQVPHAISGARSFSSSNITPKRPTRTHSRSFRKHFPLFLPAPFLFLCALAISVCIHSVHPHSVLCALLAGVLPKPLEYWERPMLVAIVGFFMLLSIAPAPDFVRMAASVLPALILLGWLLDSPRKLARALVVALTLGTLLVAPLFGSGTQAPPGGHPRNPPG